MANRKTQSNIIDCIKLPHIIKLSDNHFAAVFALMKLLPAWFILDRAKKEGIVDKGSLIVETSSGTFGLALAMLCNLLDYRFILISDPVLEAPLHRRICALGAEVVIVDKPAAVGGINRARLDRMAEIQSLHPDHFCPSQYDNPHNPGAYSYLAELLVETVGPIDCLVGTVGSGGSMSGTSAYLRKLFPAMHVVGIDTHGSVIFGQPHQCKRLLRGLGNSLIPKNVNHRAFNEVHWVSPSEAFLATRRLHERHALFMGPTSGAAYLVGSWWAEHNRNARVVTLFADEGHRYQETVYNDQWLNENNLLLDEMPVAPTPVEHPEATPPTWSAFEWNKRSYSEVVGRPL